MTFIKRAFIAIKKRPEASYEFVSKNINLKVLMF